MALLAGAWADLVDPSPVAAKALPRTASPAAGPGFNPNPSFDSNPISDPSPMAMIRALASPAVPAGPPGSIATSGSETSVTQAVADARAGEQRTPTLGPFAGGSERVAAATGEVLAAGPCRPPAGAGPQPGAPLAATSEADESVGSVSPGDDNGVGPGMSRTMSACPGGRAAVTASAAVDAGSQAKDAPDNVDGGGGSDASATAPPPTARRVRLVSPVCPARAPAADAHNPNSTMPAAAGWSAAAGLGQTAGKDQPGEHASAAPATSSLASTLRSSAPLPPAGGALSGEHAGITDLQEPQIRRDNG